MVALLFALLLVLTPQVGHTEATTFSVSLENDKEPANDLVLNGQKLDPAFAVKLQKSGTDLSRIDPQENEVWSNAKNPTSDAETWMYPNPGTDDAPPIVNFGDIMPRNPSGFLRTQVEAVGRDGTTRYYRMIMSLNLHQTLMRAALMRKLGFNVQTPQWYRRMRIRFPDRKSRETFSSSIAAAGGITDRKRWILSEDEKTNEILLQDVSLEPASMIVPTGMYMGIIDAGHLKGRRAWRGLLPVLSWMDMPENPNGYDYSFIQLLNKKLVFTHRYSGAFEETTLDDIKWMVRRIAALSPQDIQEVVLAGAYPKDVSTLILQQLTEGRNRLVRFVLGESEALFPVNLNVNEGAVVRGKLTQEKYDGYALRFYQGDPKAIINAEAIMKFVKIEAITAALHQVTSRAVDELKILSADKAFQKKEAKNFANFLEEFQKNPTKPYVRPIKPWVGPQGSIIANGSRSIVTGSYYGNQSSDFQVNLVDQISGGIRIGFTGGVDGLPRINPGFGGNLSLVRSYVHVRPVPSIEAADKKDWSELWVPNFMNGIAAVLEEPKSEKADKRLAEMNASVKKFLDELKENESFTVTDTLALDENASLNIPITTLLGIAPVSYAATISIGADANQVVLRRTTFTRQDGLIKIYLQDISSQMRGLSMDVTFWMNLVRLSNSTKTGQAITKAYHLKEKPTEARALENTMHAIRGILIADNPEVLQTNFYPIRLDHKLESEIFQGKFLFWRWTNIEEWHRVKIQPAKIETDDPNKQFNPADHERTLFSHRMLERTGKNYYSFLGDILDGLVQNSKGIKPGILTSNTGSNPADSFFGNARWNALTTEAEVTTGKESSPVTTIENVWGGWYLSKADLFKTLDLVDERLKDLKLNIPLINRTEFLTLKELQLYQIRTTLLVYQKGVTKLRDMMLKESPSPSPGVMSSIGGWDRFSSTDKQIVEDVLIPMYGTMRFADYCYKKANEGEHTRSTATSWRGVAYNCLMPWMWKVLELRRQYPANNLEERVKWTTRVLAQFERNVSLGNLISTLGQDAIFYQVKVSGFREGVEMGDKADYKSATVGSFDPKDRAGIFKDFISEFNITSSEMYASYLSEGF